MKKLLLEDDPRKVRGCSSHQWVCVENLQDAKTFTCVNCGETKKVPVKESSADGKRLLFG